MAEVRVQKKSLLARLLLSTLGRMFLAVVAVSVLLALGTFIYYYVSFGKMVETKLREGPFQNTSLIYASPEPVILGDPGKPEEIAEQLRAVGYSQNQNNRLGWYRLKENAIEIYPGVDSYFDSEGGVITFEAGRVSQIVSLRDNTSRRMFLLEPELVTNLFDKKREKRRMVRYEDIPKLMRDALISAEDKRFFEHPGIDPVRLVKAAYTDLRAGSNRQGASTLSQQLARMFFLNNDRTWKRKVAEAFITLQLEQKLTKEQIFENYSNEIYLGRKGSFNIHGFAQGSQAFFGKDLSDVKLPEAALLAGVVQGPSLYNPWKSPERAKKRRNLILYLMKENRVITEREYLEASEAPLGVVASEADSSEAPYFVDLVNDTLTQQFQDHDFQTNSYKVYTTIDMNLQRVAVDAVASGMKEVDAQLARLYKQGYPHAQVALVAVDADSGEIRALVGGRDYGQSQLNRALSKRQPGSVFKPFVYATALATGLQNDSPNLITNASVFVDEPTVFQFDGGTYEPGNFGGKLMGEVTVRYALSHSLNIPTVKIAELVGYQNVVETAQRAGLNYKIRATPSVALGSYEVSPLEIAGAYTIFPNNGRGIEPTWIHGIRDASRRQIFESKPKHRDALDPKVNYLVLSLMQEVLATGTGAGVRGRGFVLPAAGKTGSSHDGWFAGFTSKLVCAVWVGFDDNREMPLEGARSALPVWAAFMKNAHQLREYRGVHDFSPPDGIVSVDIDAETGELASPACAKTRAEYFIEGTQPVNVCRRHGGGSMQVTGWDTPEKKKGLLGKIKDIFK